MKPAVRVLWASLLAVLLAPARADGAAGDVLKRLPTPGPCPTGLAFDGKSLWLADRMTDLLYQIDPANGRVLKSLPAPGYQIEGLAVEGDCLWALDAEENLIHKVNPKKGLTEKTFPVIGTRPQGLAFDGKHLWVGDYKRHLLYQISTEDGTTISEIPSPSAEPYGLTFDGKYLWVSDRIDDMIYMVCPKKGRVVLAFPSPSKFPRGLAFDGKTLWNVDYQTDTLYQLVPHDATPYVRKNPKDETLEYFHQVRNHGPGVLTSLDIYMAVPCDLPSQKLLGKPVFTPEPAELLTDQWGQKVARFHFENVRPGQFPTVKMKVSARLFSVRFFLVPERVGTREDIPAEIAKQYLGDGTKFCLADPRIQQTARRIVGHQTNCHQIARGLFDFVSDKIRYEMVDGWDVAPKVLERGRGSCSEYSFLFVALCRSVGLPARYVGSLVIRDDDASSDDVFHRWPEVFLPGYGWVPMDPSSGRGNFQTPAAMAAAVGNRRNGYLITTISGGPSKYLGWDYNSEAVWQSKGPCKVVTERVGEWSPLRTKPKVRAAR